MGFTPKRKTYRLTFAESELSGLVVSAHSVTTGRLLSIQELLEASGSSAVNNEVDKVAASAAFRSMVEMFAEALVDWNLEDDDRQPVPATIDGLLTLESDVVLEIISAWTSAISGVSAPLASGSPSGETSLEASLQMETLSLSRAS